VLEALLKKMHAQPCSAGIQEYGKLLLSRDVFQVCNLSFHLEQGQKAKEGMLACAKVLWKHQSLLVRSSCTQTMRVDGQHCFIEVIDTAGQGDHPSNPSLLVSTM
jgi:hypothetical protein